MRYHELTELSNAERKAAVGVEADQFFTKPEVASTFASWVKSHNITSGRTIEPATGAKALSKHFPGIEMYDLHPTAKDIKQQDFLTSNMGYQEGTTVIMNPPFGNSSSLAIEFFNKAAEIADHIALIGPRTFRRNSVQKRLDSNWHLVDEYVLPRNAFYLPAEGDLSNTNKVRGYDVPAVAQIWKREDTERQAPDLPKSSQNFKFVQPRDADQATFAIRKKGRRSGQIVRVADVPNPNSFYYIQGDRQALDAFQSVNWKELGNDVMGSRSLSIPDIITAVEKQLN